MDEIESLKYELAIARHTNRRLNRRCQELESELARITKEYAIAAKDLEAQARRTRSYADQMRDLWRYSKHSLHESYAKHWMRLPKPENTFIDGIEARVNEALRRLG